MPSAASSNRRVRSPERGCSTLTTSARTSPTPGRSKGRWMERRLAEVAATLPVRRVGRPADIANAALFLAADESGFVTGQVLYVDGGRSVR